MFGHSYFSSRTASLAAVLLLLVTAGCARFDASRWSIDRLRDDRAVDIDQRLSAPKQIVQNPF